MTQYVEAADKTRRGQLTIVKQLRTDEIHGSRYRLSFSVLQAKRRMGSDNRISV